jgi:hypothetical protein
MSLGNGKSLHTKQYITSRGAVTTGVQKSRATKYHTVAPNVFSILIAVFPSHKQVHQFKSTEQKV